MVCSSLRVIFLFSLLFITYSVSSSAENDDDDDVPLASPPLPPPRRTEAPPAGPQAASPQLWGNVTSLWRQLRLLRAAVRGHHPPSTAAPAPRAEIYQHEQHLRGFRPGEAYPEEVPQESRGLLLATLPLDFSHVPAMQPDPPRSSGTSHAADPEEYIKDPRHHPKEPHFHKNHHNALTPKERDILGGPAKLPSAFCRVRPSLEFAPLSNITGTVAIHTHWTDDGDIYTFFNINLEGFKNMEERASHAFHIHENAAATTSCSSTGAHFNPRGHPHGAPTDALRHMGDLGNLEVPPGGRLKDYLIADHLVAVAPDLPWFTERSGRSLVLHAGADDFGRGDHATSRTSGAAGPRVACCTIEPVHWGMPASP